ncbi:MAG TPA: NAD(P)/FAD-dependent oxidoreductase [Acidimicrobiales bacterium]|nr:NAD(P)/FAD-dependent oxidoreductase [Acidimicrobiales bacterium]
MAMTVERATDRESEVLEVDALIVGAGVAGLYAAYRLRGLGLSFRGVEAGEDVGGTWYWNRYPGCRCDVPTIEYSYSFDEELEQEWSFPETMSAQPEIERYLNHVADRHELRPHFVFGTRVTSVVFDDSTSRWHVETDRGDRYTARWCILATGSLSAPNFPDIPGVDTFAGEKVHTGLWPRGGVDLAGKRVGIIGTGSSGIQAIPHLAAAAEHLTVFQRTPNYAFPAQVTPTDPDFEAYVKEHYRELRELQRTSAIGVSGMTRRTDDGEEQGLGAGALTGFSALADPELNKNMQELFAGLVRSRVNDPEVAEALIPKDYPVGCKRLVVEIGYYETYNRDNVTLVDLRKGGITEITATGVSTEQGDFELDVLVFATGFDAITGPLTRIDIRGRDGVSLKEKWAEGPRAYLGLVTAGFPNLFLVTGPGSPSVLSNMMVSIEQHVDFIADAIAYMRAEDLASMDADEAAEEEWIGHVNEVAVGTPFTAPSCNSWYLGANIEGKTRVFMPYVGGVGRYRETCDEIVEDGYRGFLLEPVAVD